MFCSLHCVKPGDLMETINTKIQLRGSGCGHSHQLQTAEFTNCSKARVGPTVVRSAVNYGVSFRTVSAHLRAAFPSSSSDSLPAIAAAAGSFNRRPASDSVLLLGSGPSSVSAETTRRPTGCAGKMNSSCREAGRQDFSLKCPLVS